MIRALILSDVHMGSLVGPLPKKSGYQETPVTEYLSDKFYNIMRGIGHVDLCILNGDVVDGVNRCEEGMGLYTTDMMEQCELASELVSYIDTDRFEVFNGTGYHTKVNPSGDDIVCKLLNGNWHDWQDVITLEDIKVHCRHWQPYSKHKWSRCTSQREEAYKMEHDGWDIDIFIRSHTHSFEYSGSSQNLTIGTPCWKGRDAYIEQKKMERADNGYIILNIDESNYTWEHMIFNVPEKIFSVGRYIPEY